MSQLIQQLQQRFNPQAAGSLAAVFQYELEEGGVHHLSIGDGACTLTEGGHDSPDATLGLSEATLAELLRGELDGMQAFMAGRLKVNGDMMLAMRLAEIFPAA